MQHRISGHLFTNILMKLALKMSQNSIAFGILLADNYGDDVSMEVEIV